MKHNTANRRSRNRGGGKRQGGGRNNYESNGPEVKVRGTAQQVLDKYLVLAGDAASAGDRIKSESYFQFAEHYYRIVSADGANNNVNRRETQNPQDPVPVASDRSQVIVAPESTAEVNEGNGEEVASTAVETGPETEIDREKIDDSVLPAAAPTSRPPRRRPKSEIEAEATVQTVPEPEGA